MNELTLKNPSEILSSVEPATYLALKNSLYPGAKDESIAMVISYCKAAKLDPIQKPVHIVPMWIVDKKTGKGEMRDVIMPGIGLYRIQAARSGCAGVSEPEFGDFVTETIDGVEVTYPQWCKVTVKRIIARHIVEFSSKEYWKENYATKGKDSKAPNAMWFKRPAGQLAKCAEAQALRKAFPEIGAMPTAEEMEGKVIDANEIEILEKQNTPENKGVNALKEKLGLDESINADIETGEIIEDDDMPFVTVDDVKNAIANSKSLDELVKVRSMVKELNDEEKKSLAKVYKEREKELKV